MRDEIRKAGGKCEMTPVDVRDADQCDKMVAEAVKHFGRLDVLINNHGASITTPSLNLSPNGWRAVVGINLDGVFFCSKSAARQFMEQKSPGSIVNISSTAGVHGSPTMLPYGAAKAGVIERTEKRLDRRQIQMLAANRKIVSLAGQRNEVQAKYAGGRACGDTAVRAAGAHLPGRRQMAAGQTIVSAHLLASQLARQAEAF